jgi:hypothetical protein
MAKVEMGKKIHFEMKFFDVEKVLPFGYRSAMFISYF